jgi:hypothetical protein
MRSGFLVARSASLLICDHLPAFSAAIDTSRIEPLGSGKPDKGQRIRSSSRQEFAHRLRIERNSPVAPGLNRDRSQAPSIGSPLHCVLGSEFNVFGSSFRAF